MASKMSRQVLELTGVGFKYGERSVLQDIDVSANAGELIALFGPNGSGKTTLLRLMLGLLTPSSGAIMIQGRSIAAHEPMERARRIAYVAQQPVLSFPLTVRELVRLGRFPHGDRHSLTAADTAAIDAALEQCDAGPLRERPFNALSGGEKQKVLIARALAQATPLLLLDEPTLHLDLYYQLQILQTLKRLCVERQITVITVLHDVNLVMQFADKALLLLNGRAQAFGMVGDVVNTASIKELLGVDMAALTRGDNERPFFVPR